MKKLLFFFLFLITSFSVKSESLEQMNTPEIRIGLSQGTSFVDVAKQKFPKATLVYYKDSNEDLIEALKNNKIDAFIADRISALKFVQENSDLKIKTPSIERTFYGMAFSLKNPSLRDEFSKEIQKMKADGSLKELQEKWFLSQNSSQKTSFYPKGQKGIIKIGTTAINPPFSYFINNKLSGIEVDLVNQIASKLGYIPEWSVVSHTQFISALNENTIDVFAALLTITPNRQEQVLFSEPDYADDVVFVEKKVREKSDGIESIQ